MDEKLLKISQLLNALVEKISPNNPEARKIAVDIIRTNQTHIVPFKPFIYTMKWLSQNKLAYKKNLVAEGVRLLSRHSIRSGEFLHFLDMMRPNNLSLLIPKSIPMFPVSNTVIPGSFFSILRGFSGDGFLWIPSKQKFEFITGDYMINDLSKLTANIGTKIRFISARCVPVQSIYLQAAISVAKTILEDYFSFILKLEVSSYNMSHLQYRTMLQDQNFAKIHALCIIVNTIYSMKGGELLTSLAKMQSHGDRYINLIAKEMSLSVSKIFDIMVSSWINTGHVDDPFGEFFVLIRPEVVMCSEWWEKRFYIVPENVPETLNMKEVSNIFSAGKSMDFLRNWSPYHMSLPCFSDIKSAIRESNVMMVNLFKVECNLPRLIDDIHSYMLFRRGDFAISCISKEPTFDFLDIGRALHSFSGISIPGIEVTVSTGGWGFACNVFPPVSAVIGPTEAKSYNAVSKSLLILKMAEYNIVRKMVDVRKNRKERYILYQMLQFSKLLLDYFQLQIIEPSYAKLLDDLNTIDVFDSLLTAHLRHVREISRGCWITQSGRLAKEGLNTIIDVIHDCLRSNEPVSFHQTYFNAVKAFTQRLIASDIAIRELVRPIEKMIEKM